MTRCKRRTVTCRGCGALVETTGTHRWYCSNCKRDRKNACDRRRKRQQAVERGPAADGSIRHCQNCGAPFLFTRVNKKFCSDSCTHSFNSRKRRRTEILERSVTKTCGYIACGKEFTTHLIYKKFCCQGCANRQYTIDKVSSDPRIRLDRIGRKSVQIGHEASCRGCGELFNSYHNRKYCSITCRDNANYRRYNESKKEYQRKRTRLVRLAQEILKQTGETL